MRHRHVVAAVAALVMVALTPLPASAVAASVEVDAAGTLHVQGDDRPDRIVVAPLSATEIGVSVRRGATLAVGAGCRAISRRRAACLAEGTLRVLVELGGGGDRVNLGLLTLPAELRGGDGDDVLNGGQGPDVLSGGPGRDRLNGEDGDDRLDGGLGPDALRGGPGVDTVSYDDPARTVGVQAGIPEVGQRVPADDGSAEDGPAGARDRIFSTVENLVGTGLADELTGSSVANLLRGGEGSDRVAGGDGDDTLDLADGGTGDSGDCGAGTDTVAIDQGEEGALAGCETVQAQAIGPRATLEGRWRSAALGVDVFVTRAGAAFHGVVAAADDPACFPVATVFFELAYDLAANAYTGTGLGAPGTTGACRNGAAPVRVNPSEDDRFEPQGEAASGTWKRAALADGVTYRAIDDPVGPVQIRVATVDPAAATTLDTALAQDRLGGLERTSTIAARRQAVVAVNGDYFVRATGPGGRTAFRPVHPYAEDGRLLLLPGFTDFSFAANPAETATFIGRTAVAATVEPDGGPASPVQRVNGGPPAGDEVAAFTPEGALLAAPPAAGAGCGARLAPTGPPVLRPGAGVRTPVTVTESRCDAPILPEGETSALAAVAGGAGAAFLASLAAGQAAGLDWTLRGPAPATGVFDALDVIGGTPLLVRDGASRPCNDGSAFCGLNPRTGVGVTADGRLLLVTVDGRQPGASVGMTITQFARLFVRLGARFALNFDGGGSTSMVVDGTLMNHPSDPTERPISTALLVLPGADPGQTPAGEPPAATRQSVQDQTAVWEAVADDPGSTGGLAEHLAAAGQPLPPELDQVADAFADP